MTPLLRIATRLAVVGLAVVAAGCGDGGPETEEVTGKVTFRGRPLTTGSVVLWSKSGEVLEPAPVDSNGTFRLQAPVGTYRVAVIAMPSLDPGGSGGNPEESVGPIRSYIPEAYGNPETSGLEIEVKAEETNDVSLELR